MADKDHVEKVKAANERMITEVADLLRKENPWRGGWDHLDEVQKADAVEFFLNEVERFAMSNFEGRPISRESTDRLVGTRQRIDHRAINQAANNRFRGSANRDLDPRPQHDHDADASGRRTGWMLNRTVCDESWLSSYQGDHGRDQSSCFGGTSFDFSG